MFVYFYLNLIVLLFGLLRGDLRLGLVYCIGGLVWLCCLGCVFTGFALLLLGIVDAGCVPVSVVV